jgi:ATP-dependent Clp protease protease subunit
VADPRPPLPAPPARPERPAPQPLAPSVASSVSVTGSDPVLDQLTDERIVHVGGVLDDDAAQRVCSRLRLLAARDPRRDILLTVHCTGGSATAALAVVDTVGVIGPDVATCAVGVATGVGQLLVTAGAPGRRTATPHARLALRTPHAGPVGAAVFGELKREIVEVVATRSGQPPERVAADTAAERWFTAAEAVEYGLIDAVDRA